MSRPAGKPGRRISVWLKPEHLSTADEIENLSNFFQIALEQAASIMAFDIIKKQRALSQPPPTPEAVERWNADHPLDNLTAKRTGKITHDGSAPRPITGNSALDN